MMKYSLDMAHSIQSANIYPFSSSRMRMGFILSRSPPCVAAGPTARRLMKRWPISPMPPPCILRCRNRDAS